jgi:hypothetical protein
MPKMTIKISQIGHKSR